MLILQASRQTLTEWCPFPLSRAIARFLFSFVRAVRTFSRIATAGFNYTMMPAARVVRLFNILFWSPVDALAWLYPLQGGLA